MSEFDYIIVGSGSGGGVVASRLTEDAGISALVLESGGPDNNIYFHMGIGFYRNRPANLNWGFVSEPEPQLNNRRLDLPQGHLLGGSSAINGKIYSRGHPVDYDEWRQMGCEGWSFAEVLPYFKRAEGSWRGNSTYHSGDGPLKTSAVSPRGLLQEPLIAAARAQGHRIVDDLDSEPFEGISHLSDITVDGRGRRSSTARAYLRPILKRPNLHLLLHAKATRILVEDGRAVGIEFIQGGRRRIVRARKEVVLSAGVYNTARLLMLSGIGAADELRQAGVEPILDLPGVGKNIADHATYMLSNKTKERLTPIRQLRLDRAGVHFMQWLLAGTGLFATQPLMAQGLLKSKPDLERPDIQIFFNPVRRDARAWFPLVWPEQEHRIEAGIILLHPLSRGTMKLKSADPAEPPSISLNLLSDQRDAQTLIRAVRLTREIYRAEPLKSLVAREIVPGEGVESDEQILGAIRQALYTVRHPVGTCRMGVDDMAVVDPQLRVHGITGLRIADASVMPAIPGGNTNAPTIMIGEKAADLIRGKPPLLPAQL
ncbi:GMC family oxidoreductase [Xanthobacter autotrophicus]|uniref:GMC family oxidoreductase n=1 Tax=Xanthobacter autotrophicus TaxID=280 RepID=UPI0024A714FC|nr:GMC family oxidoreductase N-terminal domain-containing protein [Xanthobacter autotrophicus]MDI4655139.1 GMC family oxidoreductase N-terminal domain-containing protein [Xanthobacter autotrophicus]